MPEIIRNSVTVCVCVCMYLFIYYFPKRASFYHCDVGGIGWVLLRVSVFVGSISEHRIFSINELGRWRKIFILCGLLLFRHRVLSTQEAQGVIHQQNWITLCYNLNNVASCIWGYWAVQQKTGVCNNPEDYYFHLEQGALLFLQRYNSVISLLTGMHLFLERIVGVAHFTGTQQVKMGGRGCFTVHSHWNGWPGQVQIQAWFSVSGKRYYHLENFAG